MNVLKSLVLIAIMFIFATVALKACNHEAEQNEIKNRQWIQDAKDGKPYTNYGE